MPATEAVHDNVEVCGEPPNVTLAGLRVHVSPAGTDVPADRLTVPVKPLMDCRVTVEVPEEPVLMGEGDTGPAATEKSVTGAAGNVMMI